MLKIALISKVYRPKTRTSRKEGYDFFSRFEMGLPLRGRGYLTKGGLTTTKQKPG